MRIVKSSKTELENLKRFVEEDSTFNNYVEWRSHHAENYEDDLSDIYNYIRQSAPKIESPEEKPLLMNFLNSSHEDLIDMRKRAQGKEVLSYLATKSAARLYDEIIDDKLKEAADAAKKSEDERTEAESKALKKAANSMKLEIRKKVEKFKEEYDEAEEALTAMAVAGDSKESKPEKLNMKDSLDLLKKMKTNNRVKDVMKLIGKFQNLAQHKLMTKTTDNEKLVGIELGGEIHKLIPDEIALLSDPDFEDLKLIALLEDQLIQHKFESDQPKTGGPIVVCVDESGSMTGSLIANAKAFLFGMWQVAKAEGRKLYCVRFGGPGNVVSIEVDGIKTLMEIIENFMNDGDTCFESALNEARRIIENGGEFETADIAFITDDGGRSFSKGWLEDFNAFRKQTQTKVVSLALLPYAELIKQFSDQVVYGFENLSQATF